MKWGTATAKKRKVTDPEKIGKLQEVQNTVEHILEKMRSDGRAGGKVTFEYKRRQKKWEPSVEETVLQMIDAEPGWYFFGLSVSGGHHTVTLVVDNTEESAPKIYWMDQNEKGFTNDVTGKLEKEIENSGTNDTRIWPMLPPENLVESVE